MHFDQPRRTDRWVTRQCSKMLTGQIYAAANTLSPAPHWSMPLARLWKPASSNCPSELVIGTCCVCRASRIAARCKRVQENLAAARQGDGAGKDSGHPQNKSNRHRVMRAVTMSWLRPCTILPQWLPSCVLYAPGGLLCPAGRFLHCPRHPVDA